MLLRTSCLRLSSVTLFKEIVVLCSIMVGFFLSLVLPTCQLMVCTCLHVFFTRKLCRLIELVSFLRLSTEIIVVKKDFLLCSVKSFLSKVI